MPQKSPTKKIIKAYSTDSTSLKNKRKKNYKKGNCDKNLSNSESLLEEKFCSVLFLYFFKFYLFFRSPRLRNNQKPNLR